MVTFLWCINTSPFRNAKTEMSLHNCLTCNASESAPETQFRKPFFIHFLARFIHQHSTKISTVQDDLLFRNMSEWKIIFKVQWHKTNE